VWWPARVEGENTMTSFAGVETEMLEIRLPQVFPTMTAPDILEIKQWYVQEQEIVQPGKLLLEVGAPIGYIDIPTPPFMTVPHRVVSIAKKQGESIKMGDILITLEPTA